jgi:small-conductance mechanosensitive channel
MLRLATLPDSTRGNRKRQPLPAQQEPHPNYLTPAIPFRRRPGTTACRQEPPLIILGIILLIIGFVAGIAILWTIGIIVLIAGVILALLGMAGHAVGGRRHYY